jgi:hypothetical protein
MDLTEQDRNDRHPLGDMRVQLGSFDMGAYGMGAYGRRTVRWCVALLCVYWAVGVAGGMTVCYETHAFRCPHAGVFPHHSQPNIYYRCEGIHFTPPFIDLLSFLHLGLILFSEFLIKLL